MSINWRNTTLGDELTFQRGFDITKNEQIPGLNMVFSSSGPNSTHTEYKVEGPGVIIGRKGSLGTVFFSKDNYWPHDTTLWIKDFHGNDPKFAFYFLQGLHLEQYDSGASNPSLNRNHIHLLPILYPSNYIQRKIANILSAYDDLIENNTRRIAILEEMAQRIYKEWFVDFKYPGHENDKLVDSELGMIPEGWEVKSINEICKSVNYGYTEKAKKEFVGPKFLRITDIVPNLIDWDSVPYCKIDKNNLDKYSLIEGDIVVARTGATTGYAKRLNKLHPPTVFASYLVRLRVKDGYSSTHLGAIVVSNKYKKFIKSIIGGAAQPNANAKMLTSMKIIIPSSKWIKEFEGIIHGFLDEEEIFQERNKILRQTRDLLLPKLISCQVDVSKIQIRY